MKKVVRQKAPSNPPPQIRRRIEGDESYVTSLKMSRSQREQAEQVILECRQKTGIKLSFADLVRIGLPHAFDEVRELIENALEGKKTTFKKRKDKH